MIQEATSVDNSIDLALRTAIRERRIITFTLDNCHRVAEPHDYGIIDGSARLLCYQIGGTSNSPRPLGWRWAKLAKISDLQLLDRHFAGPRPAPSGQHVRWEQIFASVSKAAIRPQRRAPPKHPG